MNFYPNIVIPMAGRGSRFIEARYTQPKPFITVRGKPMIQQVLENIPIKGTYIMLYTKGFYTEGTVKTVLLVENSINNDTPLIIANSDQIFTASEDWYEYFMNYDGGILTFKATDKKWSFIEAKDGLVIRVAEKEPISDNATVGVYFWRKGSDFIKYAKKMIERDVRVNGEFYTAPVYNEAINDGKKIAYFQVNEMHGLGTPEDVKNYENNI